MFGSFNLFFSWTIIALLFFAFMLLTSSRLIWRALWIGLGSGSLMAALVSLLPFLPFYQWLVGLPAALIIFLISYFVDRRPSTAGMENILGIDRIIGQEALVLITINPVTHGRVRVARENWRAFSDDGSTILAGVKVQVLAISGPYLRVRPLPS